MVGHEFPKFERMPWSQAMDEYGIDKPDLRFGMKLVELTDIAQHNADFKLFTQAEYVGAICCPKVGTWGNKKVKELDKMARSGLIGAGGLVWIKCESLAEGKEKFDSSCKKFFGKDDFLPWAKRCGAQDGDCICIFAGPRLKTQECLGKFRHEMGTRLGMRNEGYHGLWVVDFPLLEWDEDEKRFTAMHHPFTSPKQEDFDKMESDPGAVRANAYDMVINGVEVGGGSIRIFDKKLQHKVFNLLGFSEEEAEAQFGFLLGAFEFGAPPHGGLAFGLDRLCTILGGGTSIRDYIAFPKNQQGRDTMINSPSEIADKQKAELCIAYAPPQPEEPATDEAK